MTQLLQQRARPAYGEDKRVNRPMQRAREFARQTRNARRKARAFTLIEIMMVVVIIGIIAAVLVPNLVGQADKARVRAEKTSLVRIAAALEAYKLDNYRYPTTDQGLRALVSEPSGFPEAKNWGPDPYWPKLPRDQWDNEYVYSSDGRRFELKPLGADGTDGGDDSDADIAYGED